MAGTPEYLTLRRNRDQAGRREVRVRRALVVLVSLLLVAGLLNAFGQRPATSKAAAAAASLKVYAPDRVRGGLLYEARFNVTARRDVKNATLVLSSGWLEGITINTIEPSPVGSASRNGDLSYDLGHIPAGESYILFVQQQVNPTTVSRRTQRAELWDGERHLLTIERPFTVWP